MKKVMAFVYIAGPYTKGDVVLNIQKAIYAAEELIKAGYVPYVPHLSHLWHYEYDPQWLKKCDCLVRLPGKSRGADNEVALAKDLCMPVYRSVKSCIRGEAKYLAELEGK